MKFDRKFGQFGGQYVPETIMNPLKELEAAFEKYIDDEDFKKEYDYLMKQYVGRPNPLYFAERLTEKLGGAKIYIKREDLNHTGSHKINNGIGQMLLARRLGKKKVIAESGNDVLQILYETKIKQNKNSIWNNQEIEKLSQHLYECETRNHQNQK